MPNCFLLVTIEYMGKRVTTEGLPLLPKVLLYQSAQLKSPDPQVMSYIRRFRAVGINGGIPVDLFRHVSIPLPASVTAADPGVEASSYFSREQFSRTSLNIGGFDHVRVQSDEFDLIRYNLANYIHASSNEHSLCGLLWYPLINACIFGARNEEEASHELAIEWQTTKVLPLHGDRRVDLAMTVNCQPLSGIPIVLVEAGKGQALSRLEHKDNSKLLGMVSSFCIRMAYQLAQDKIDPALARTYGLLVGGTKAQLCIAHPEFRETGEIVDGKRVCEIHANVSFSEHWVFDLLSPTETPVLPSTSAHCEDGCCRSEAMESISTIIPPSQPISFDPRRYDWSLQSPFTTIHGVQEPDQPMEAINFEGELNIQTLQNLKRFFTGVLHDVDSMCSKNEQFIDTSNRVYVEPKKDGVFSRSKPELASQITPEKQQFETVLGPEHKVIPIKFGRNVASAFMKFSFENPMFFPIVLSAVEVDADVVELVLEPSLDASEVGFIVDHGRVFSSLAACIKFGLDCVHSLYLLHESFGVSLAGKIAPEDFGFSLRCGIWKFFHFSSVVTENVTDEMRAEDILGLGGALEKLFVTTVMELVLNSEFDTDEDLNFAMNEFVTVILRMKCSNASDRLSLLEALSGMMTALLGLHFDNEPHGSDPVYLNVKAILQAQAEAEVEEEKASTATERKGPV